MGAPPNPIVLSFVSQTDPIRVRFSIDERRYLQFARSLIELQKSQRERPAGPGLELILADGTLHEHRGRVVATDAAVNPTTGTFTLEADFPNPDRLVLAGHFARVRAVVETRVDALLVPQRAVSEVQGNFRVFVIARDGTVALRPVEPGPRIDRLQIIESGLRPDERVAVEGLLQIREGMVVAPKLVDQDEFDSSPDEEV